MIAKLAMLSMHPMLNPNNTMIMPRNVKCVVSGINETQMSMKNDEIIRISFTPALKQKTK